MDTYQRGHVTVDDTFARFGSKSYALNKINSVEVRVDERNSIAWLLFAVLAALLAFGSFTPAKDATGPTIPALFFAAIAAVISVLLYRKRTSRSYQLMLATSSGEVQATLSPDLEAISELRREIETRMVRA